MIYQDPYGSLNPRMTVGECIGEALAVHNLAPRAEIPARTAELLQLVGLPPDAANATRTSSPAGSANASHRARAQRRAGLPDRRDEPVSALDVSVQAQIVNLFLELQARLGLTLVFITHDSGCSARVASHRGDVSRAHRRDRPGARSVRDAAPSLHPRADCLGAATRAPTSRRARGGFGRDPEPAGAALRLRISSALSESIGHLSTDAARSRDARRRLAGRLPLRVALSGAGGEWNKKRTLKTDFKVDRAAGHSSARLESETRHWLLRLDPSSDISGSTTPVFVIDHPANTRRSSSSSSTGCPLRMSSAKPSFGVMTVRQ